VSPGILRQDPAGGQVVDLSALIRPLSQLDHHAPALPVSHLSLDKDTPDSRPIEPPERGAIIPISEVGGLHHRDVRHAA
jgi:hypothetical protein